MHITISSIGKFRNNPHKEIFDLYKKRLPWKLELKEIEAKPGLVGDVLKQKEGELLISSLPKSAKIIALDENGKNMPSKDFANLLAGFARDGESNLAFIIGGADGISAEIKQKSHLTISLGKMTFPHMMVRGILAEQLYRAYTIINNHPYHRE